MASAEIVLFTRVLLLGSAPMVLPVSLTQYPHTYTAANPAMAPAIIAALTDPAVIAALAAAMGPAITAAVNAAVGPAVNAAVGPAVDAALVPLETRIARAYNRSSLSQSDASAPLMPLPQPITGAVPNDFPATKHDFDVLSQPPLTHNKLKKSYR